MTHHRQLVGERQGFTLVMGDQDGGDARVFQQPRNHLAHGGAQAGIERRERLVQQHQPWLLRQGSGQGHALLLATGQFMGPALGHLRVQRHAVHQFGNALLFFSALGRQAEADVRCHGHVREQCAVLWHVADQALMGRHFVGAVDQGLAIERQASGIGELETGNHPQQRGLARAGGAYDDRATAAGHREADVVQGAMGAIGLVEGIQFKSVHRPAVFFDW
ncbi:hypothetical protein D3C81_951990 [compost metagenome]